MRPRRTWGHAAHAAIRGASTRLDARRAHAAHAEGASTRPPAPHAAGEDVRALTGAAQPAARSLGRAEASARATDGATPPRRYRAGADALTDETGSARWRQARQQRATLGWLRRGAVAGVGGVGRWLRRAGPARIFALGAPLTLLLALLIWLLASPYWQTRHLRVVGTSDPALLALARAQRLTGCDAFRCDFSAAQRAIASSTRVEQVSIRVVYPDTTLVQITPRQTVALWRAQGQLWAVGADGVVIGSATRLPALASPGAVIVDDTSASVPLRPGARIDSALVAMARQLRRSAAGDGLLASSLRYTSADGFTMQASGGALVVFGGPADAQATLADINGAAATAPPAPGAAVPPALAAQGAQAQAQAASAILRVTAQRGTPVSWIDVRWGSHPYYR